MHTQGDRLADLLERVGGLTPRAYPQGIRFVRNVDGVGRININLPSALRNRDSRDNVVLQPNDAIVIPEYEASVRIVGAVNTPGSALYRPGEGIGYYINAAGGGTRLAILGEASVRQPNGEVQTRRHVLWFFRSDPDPQPGAEVLVPAHDPAEKTGWIALTGGLAQILGSMVAIIVVVSKL